MIKKLTRLVDNQFEFIIGSGANKGSQPTLLRRWFPFIMLMYLTLLGVSIYLIAWELTKSV